MFEEWYCLTPPPPSLILLSLSLSLSLLSLSPFLSLSLSLSLTHTHTPPSLSSHPSALKRSLSHGSIVGKAKAEMCVCTRRDGKINKRQINTFLFVNSDDLKIQLTGVFKVGVKGDVIKGLKVTSHVFYKGFKS